MNGISNPKKTHTPPGALSLRGSLICVASIFVALVVIYFVLQSILVIYVTLIIGVFLLMLLLPPERTHKDLERQRRDIDRRAHFIGGPGGGGKGLIFFEDGGPTPYDPYTDEEKY